MGQVHRTGSGVMAVLAGGMTVLFVALQVGCGDDIGSKRPGEPCTRTEQCMQGLLCVDGVCRDPDDGGAVD